MSMYPYTNGEKMSPQFDFFAALMEGRVGFYTQTNNGESRTTIHIATAEDELET